MDSNKKDQLFSEFIKDATILLVDRSPRTRSRLTKSIIDLGANRMNIHSVAHYEEAIAICNEHHPQMILSDYVIRGGSGFDLFKTVREEIPEMEKSILVLITSNISQSAVAKAAEEDVDAFLIKPYNINTFDRSLKNATISKLHPSEYIKVIEEGKEHLFKGDFEDAIRLFEKAFELNKKPALAHFYHGQAKYMMENKNDAITDYNKGLEYNAIHYKCQIGLYDLFVKEQEFDKAYGVVKNITKYFPANPKRLKEVIRLAIRTHNYKDLNSYYNTFLDLEEREDDVVDYVCSGMYILGKYNLEHARDEKSAVDAFEKVGVSSGGRPKFLKAIIRLLARYQMHDLGYSYLKRFPHDEKEGADYKFAKFLIESHTLNDDDKIKYALEIYNEGLKEFEVFSTLVKSMYAKEFDKKAEEYLQEAKELFPDRSITVKKHQSLKVA